MSLNRGTVNPLNVLGVRKLEFIPNHFSKITVKHKVDTKNIEHWIEYNLNSRYAIQIKHGLDDNRKITSVTIIGVEDPKELTMLSLGCQFLHNKKDIF